MNTRLTTKEAADLLGYSAATLKRWRHGAKTWQPGLGPRFYTINGRVFYRRDWIEDWERLHWDSRERLDE